MKRIASILLFCALILFVLSASAQEEVDWSVRDIRLGVDELTLKPGSSFIFNVELTPADTGLSTLVWSVLDPEVAEVDPRTNTVTAIAAGETWLFAQGFDAQASAVCHLIVEGSAAKDAAPASPGEEAQAVLALSDEDLAKVTDPSLHDLLTLLQSVPVSALVHTDVFDNPYKLLVSTVPGKEESVSEAAYLLGAADATPLPEVNLVTLQASVGQIARLLKGNDDILSAANDTMTFFSAKDEKASSSHLAGKTEELTQVSRMHDLGIKGKGTTIAVIDCGFSTTHPEFEGRIVDEFCSGTDLIIKGYETVSPCVSDYSAVPAKTNYPALFDHGTHVAGIAAGKNGIAPEAKMVLIAAFSEAKRAAASKEKCQGEYENGWCHFATSIKSDQFKAYKHLIDLVDSGVQVSVLNMSYGDNMHAAACDKEEPIDYQWFTELKKRGILPIAAAGNSSSREEIGNPSCVSNVMSVGALCADETPTVTYYSNHNSLIDITAPGDDIISANYLYGSTQGAPEFIEMSGTSMAAPMVTGGAALLKQLYPNSTPDQLKTLLTTSPKSADKIQVKNEDGKGYKAAEMAVVYPEKTADYIKPVLNFGNYSPAAPDDILIVTTEDPIAAELTINASENTNHVRLTVTDPSSVILDEDLYEAGETEFTKTLTGLEAETVYTVRVIIEHSDGKKNVSLNTLHFDDSIHASVSAGTDSAAVTVKAADETITKVTVGIEDDVKTWEQPGFVVGGDPVSKTFDFNGLQEDKAYKAVITAYNGTTEVKTLSLDFRTVMNLTVSAKALTENSAAVSVSGSKNVKSLTVTLTDPNGKTVSEEYANSDGEVFSNKFVFDGLEPKTNYQVTIVWKDSDGTPHTVEADSVQTPEPLIIFRQLSSYAIGDDTGDTFTAIHVEGTVSELAKVLRFEIYPETAADGEAAWHSAVHELPDENINKPVVLYNMDLQGPAFGVNLDTLEPNTDYFIFITALDEDNMPLDSIPLLAYTGKPSKVDGGVKGKDGIMIVDAAADKPSDSAAVLVIGSSGSFEDSGKLPARFEFSELEPGEDYTVLIYILDEEGHVLMNMVEVYRGTERPPEEHDELIFYRLESDSEAGHPLPATGFPTDK